jgi:tetratricopeptide (TPR) repeat protein
VIPTPEQLEEVSLQSEGSLTAVPFAALLLALSVHRRTMMVELRRKQISKRIVIENGVPIDCRSNLVHETLGRYLVAGGKLDAADLHTYLGQSASLGQPLGEVLLDHGVLTAEELFKLLQQNLAKKMLDLFTWRDGEFRTHSEVPRPDSSLKIRVPQLIVTGVTKFASQEEVDAGVVPLVGKKLCLHPRPPFALDEIRLNQRQSQVAVALRSGWRIDELALGTGMPFEELTRLLYALAVLGVVITADHPEARAVLRAAKATATVAEPRLPAAAAPPDAAPAEAAPQAAASQAVPDGAAGSAAAPDTAPPRAPRPHTRPVPGTPHPVPSGAAALAGVTGLVGLTGPAAGAPAAAAGFSPEAAARSATRPIATLQPPPPPPVSPPPPAAATTPAAPAAAPAAKGDPGELGSGRAVTSDSAGAEALQAAERRRNEIMEAYLSYRRLDSFDLLGVDEEASPAEVETHYLDFARRFAPWSLSGPELAGGMEEKARDLFLAGARACAELLDLEQRNTLLFRRRVRRDERSRAAAADLAIKTDLLDPEVQYRKGRSLMDAGRFQEAAVLLEFASDCDPQNGLYSAELAYCRFCHTPGQGAKALKEIQETLRRDPDCGLAVYYAGEIHRQMGAHDEAEKMLRRAIKMMAPDRRPIEALKALSAERRK